MNVNFDEKVIDAIFSSVDQTQFPGAAVGIALGGIPAYRKGFGLASMGTPATLSPRTRMRIHSITKHFTCLAYLLLCEEGKAGIDDPIAKRLPEMHPVAHAVTMRQLMSNTSGLRDARDLRSFFNGYHEAVSASDLLTMYREIPDANFEPGKAWCYNNGAFQILSAIIERIEERPLEEVLQKRIFEPVGMNDTMLKRLDDNFVPNAAAMHVTGPTGAYEKYNLAGELVGEGGIISTVDDVLRWLKHMREPVVGIARTWNLLRTPQSLATGEDTGYALGLLHCPYRNLDAIWHSGAGPGSNAQMVRLPALDLDIVVLSNRVDVSSMELTSRVIDYCIGAEPSATLRQREPSIVGTFCSQWTGRTVKLYVEGGAQRQLALVDGVGVCHLAPCGDESLCSEADTWESLTIKWRGDPRTPASIGYRHRGNVDELAPVPPEWSSGPASIGGQYILDSVGAQIVLDVDGEVGHMTTIGQFGGASYRLERLAGALWQIKQSDGGCGLGILTADASGGAVAIRTLRNWKLSFRRLS